MRPTLADLELAGQSAEAGDLVRELPNRRPEWFAVWMARGAMLAIHNQPGDARPRLETAVALGARSPQIRDLLAGKAPADLGGLFLARPPREW